MYSASWSKRFAWALCTGAGLLAGHAFVAAQAPSTPQAPAKIGEPVPKAGDVTQPPTTPGLNDLAGAQSPYDSGDLGGGSLSTMDSSVGYIDSAIPASQVKLRFDAAWKNNRPTRAEFFYPQYQPGGPGLPTPDSNIDYQELSAYLEGALSSDFSVFLNAPIRFLNPTINDNTAGFSDLELGFKYAFINCPDQVTTFQTRLSLPTGDGDRGLGRELYGLEPSLLAYNRLSDRLRMESELRLWVPIAGTSFAGPVLRYGVGFSFGERSPDDLWITPVVEVVGWTVLGGRESIGPHVPFESASAAGDTIINAKLGVRIGLGDVGDIYSGYGRALTGEVWYKDIWRTELRIPF